MQQRGKRIAVRRDAVFLKRITALFCEHFARVSECKYKAISPMLRKY